MLTLVVGSGVPHSLHDLSRIEETNKTFFLFSHLMTSLRDHKDQDLLLVDSASFQMLQKLALFLVRKITQNFTRVGLLALSRTLVPSVLGTIFAASRYAFHLYRPLYR